MRLEGEQVLLRIFVDSAHKHHHRPVYELLVERARDAGLAGATVLKGLMGFGKSSRLHTAKLLEVSTNLPVVIEIVDTQERIDTFMPAVDELVSNGLVTIERVKVVKYASGDTAQ